ncbi:MAG: hypothetical protein A2Y16_04375 [Tenericutes bacterium GWF2_57_13]|nr:MAG: hypothetical protein A2Y16_04375 [Tenericutes bacterium GWF2_57_13]
MFRKFICAILALFMVFGSVGCSEAMTTGYFDNGNADNEDIVPYGDETLPERKIVYEVNISFDVNVLETAATFLKAQMEADEWFDREVITSTLYSYVIRVKTERLDAFITALQDEFVLRSYSKIGTDISLDYQDATNRILSLEAQLARLLELYDLATLEEMILINEQISDIEVELQELEGTLNQFDSLIEYSEVTLVFYGSAVTSDSPFFNRLANAFVNGFNALVGFVEGLMIVIASMSPFLFILGVLGLGIWFVTSRKKRKAKHPTEQK